MVRPSESCRGAVDGATSWGRYPLSWLLASAFSGMGAGAGGIACTLVEAPRDAPPTCPGGPGCPAETPEAAAPASPGEATGAPPTVDEAVSGPWSRGGALGVPARGIGPTVPPEVAWEVDVGAPITGGAALGASAGGDLTAFVGSHAGRVVGVVIEGPRAGTIALDLNLPGIVWGTPAIDRGGRLHVGADDDVLYAIDPMTRAIAWSLRLGACEPPRSWGPEGVRCDPDGGPTVGPEGDLYVGADGLYRIDREGRVRWHYPASDDPRPRHVYGAPLVTGDGSVFFGGYDGAITALAGDGTLRWQVALGPDVDAAPVIAANGLVIFGVDDGRVIALDPEGRERWSFRAGREVRAPLTLGRDGSIYAASLDGNLHVLDPGGALRWSYAAKGPIASAPAVDAAGNVFFGSQDDHVHALDPAGRLLWRMEMPEDVDAPVTITRGGALIVGCDDGVLRALR